MGIRTLEVKLTLKFEDNLDGDDREAIKEAVFIDLDACLRHGEISTADHDPKDWIIGSEWNA